MEIIKVIAFCLVAVFLYVFLKDKKPDVAIQISIVSGVLIFLFLLPKINEVITFINTISQKAGVDLLYIGVIFKILAIAYLASFCSELCKDAGANSLGAKVEFSAKILILALSIPILMAVLDSILKIL
ncbi:stage III sporulation protein AD [Clostridium cavendishii DSM 21758]|uniref:Stage III sporulation protein AD n=1 Tax=Clostridium cavendishii DSM 21758 TaxID=1121302 RepID=A0A1M6KKY6_9CLOT|nr:stage III sporulation protein AD [Clostridium cavendishii]SHJ59623.1 stage III sporulation protein AD [Clostridium cavendishii DSM 21758]